MTVQWLKVKSNIVHRLKVRPNSAQVKGQIQQYNTAGLTYSAGSVPVITCRVEGQGGQYATLGGQRSGSDVVYPPLAGSKVRVCVSAPCRVEGQGLATITDVVYSTSLAQDSCSNLSDDRQTEYQALLKEMREKERQTRTLHLTEEVLKEERALLTKYANRIFKNGSAKVIVVYFGDFKLQRS